MRENRYRFLAAAEEPPNCRAVTLTSLLKRESLQGSFPEEFSKEGENERFMGAREGDARQSAAFTA